MGPDQETRRDERTNGTLRRSASKQRPIARSGRGHAWRGPLDTGYLSTHPINNVHAVKLDANGDTDVWYQWVVVIALRDVGSIRLAGGNLSPRRCRLDEGTKRALENLAAKISVFFAERAPMYGFLCISLDSHAAHLPRNSWRNFRVAVTVKSKCLKKLFRKRTNSGIVTIRVVLFQFVAPDGREFNRSSFCTQKQTGRRAINIATLGSFSMKRCDWEKPEWHIFFIFIEPETQ